MHQKGQWWCLFEEVREWKHWREKFRLLKEKETEKTPLFNILLCASVYQKAHPGHDIQSKVQFAMSWLYRQWDLTVKLTSSGQLNLQNLRSSDLQMDTQTGLLLFDKSMYLYLFALAEYFTGANFLMPFWLVWIAHAYTWFSRYFLEFSKFSKYYLQGKQGPYVVIMCFSWLYVIDCWL